MLLHCLQTPKMVEISSSIVFKGHEKGFIGSLANQRGQRGCYFLLVLFLKNSRSSRATALAVDKHKMCLSIKGLKNGQPCRQLGLNRVGEAGTNRRFKIFCG
jgi:hypothetical protein